MVKTFVDIVRKNIVYENDDWDFESTTIPSISHNSVVRLK